MYNLFHKFFLEERPSISLSFFRMAAAVTAGFHVLPTFCHLGDNYFSTSFKEVNLTFFTPQIVLFIQKSPPWLIQAFVGIFCVFWFLFLIGLWSQLSCIVMTTACYYFYALNSFHVGTLSWDILLVTLFLMCWTPYHGDYFSLDCLLRANEDAYKKTRPFFLQRLLQLQIGFNYFYTALYKIMGEGNWLKDNPVYYLMNYPTPGVMKIFILKDYLLNKPELCYALGIFIVIIEISMIFLLFNPKTRISAIYLGFIFHLTLILTMDVPAIFLFLFPPQLLLFINPEDVVRFIEQKRLFNASSSKQAQLIFDGRCQFCQNSVRILKIMDLFGTLKYVDLHQISDFKLLHPQLDREKALSQLHLIEPDGRLYGGFEVFRRICFTMPMLYPLSLVFYFPGMSLIGPWKYKIIAKNRYFFHFNRTCQNNACYR